MKRLYFIKKILSNKKLKYSSILTVLSLKAIFLAKFFNKGKNDNQIVNGSTITNVKNNDKKIEYKDSNFVVNRKLIHEVPNRYIDENNYLIHYCNKSKRVNSKFSRGILQGEAGITNNKSKLPILGSFAAKTSVIVAVYNKKDKIASLAQIDAVTDINQAIYLLLSKTATDKNSKLEVSISSGETQFNETLKKIKGLLSKNNNVTIKEYNSTSLAIDSKDGKIFTGISHNQLDSGKDKEIRLELRGVDISMFAFTERKLLLSINFDERAVDFKKLNKLKI